jgi:hypothetical protein
MATPQYAKGEECVMIKTRGNERLKDSVMLTFRRWKKVIHIYYSIKKTLLK